MTSSNEQNLSQDITINGSLNNSSSSDELIADSQKRSDQCQDHDSKFDERSNVDESSTRTVQDDGDTSRIHFHLNDFGDKVVGTVKHGLVTVFGTGIEHKNDHEQTSRRPLTLRSSESSSPEIVQEQISETEEELLFVFSST